MVIATPPYTDKDASAENANTVTLVDQFDAAGPIVVGVAGRVTSRLPRRSRTAPSSPETFTPAPAVDEPAPAVAEPTAPKPGAPSPATVARNVAGPRPTANSPAKRKPRSVPGAKLPVTRPST